MLLGNVLFSWKTWGLLVILVRAMYKAALKTSTLMIIPKLNEKIIMSKEDMMDIIITAKRERGSPKMTALFLIFL